MPETAAQSQSATAARKRAAREAARRRDVVTLLNVSGATIWYAVRQLGDGLPPEQARQVAIESAAELEAVAAALYRAVRLGPAERRSLARQLAAIGMSRREIADRLGVSDRAVWNYLRAGPGAS